MNRGYVVMSKDKLQEAADFFRKEPGFKRLFEKFINNYKSLGRFGGTAKLVKLTTLEKEALSGLMGKDYSKQSSVTISVKEFEKALEKTRFSSIDLKTLLFSYIGENILTKSEEEEKYVRIKETFFRELLAKYPENYCQHCLKYLQANEIGTRGVNSSYKENPVLLKEQLIKVLEAICKLPQRTNNKPNRYWRLPVFADLVTNDPHAFDLNSQQGRLLIFALGYIRTLEDTNYQLLNNTNSEEITELLSYFGIIRDDILNFVTFSGIIACDEAANKAPEWWQKCWEEGVVINVPLREILKRDSFYPANGKKVVFVVENSGVFSEILDKFPDRNLPPLICTNGQFKLAALILLDRLAKNDVIIYYSGDFDPEGLLMAQRLKTRYPAQVRLWHYTEEDYKKSQSEVALSENRLNKLKNLNLEELAKVKDYMEKSKIAGYQERLINELVKDIAGQRL